MRMLPAGDLRHRVRLQREAAVNNADGSDDVSFSDVATLWANVSTIGGREFYQAKKLTPELTHQVRLRYRADIKGGMRFLYGPAVLRVTSSVDPDGDRVELLVMCQELVQ